MELAIAHKLIHDLGGTLELVSSPAKAVFVLPLPSYAHRKNGPAGSSSTP